jgi:adenosylmethionine---8-amino-7-oxononanoate aminotransferase
MTNLKEIDRSNIWHPFTSLVNVESPVLIRSAEGVYLQTDDGRNIIDAVSSWWVNLHGHGNQYIAKAIAKQALELEHVIFAGFTHEPAIELSQKLLSILPSNQKKLFFSDNGSTAVEVGLKMALQYWHNSGVAKKKIVAFKGAYHGDTFGSMSVGERGIFTEAFSRYLFDVCFIDVPFENDADRALAQFEEICADNDVAAFIYEPLVQGAAGMKIYSAAGLDRIIACAKSKKVICIADEVFTGFGRTGKLFASAYLMNPPDIMCISKGITGGFLPLGVTSCSDSILSAYQDSDKAKTFFHGHSYTANPIACAAAIASFDLLVSQQCQHDITRISTRHKAFAAHIEKSPAVQSANALGTILSVELRTSESTSYMNPARQRIYSFFLERNILLRPLGNIIYVLPPYIISDQELSTIYSAIEEFCNQ